MFGQAREIKRLKLLDEAVAEANACYAAFTFGQLQTTCVMNKHLYCSLKEIQLLTGVGSPKNVDFVMLLKTYTMTT